MTTETEKAEKGGSGAKTVAQIPPSTRAGGQDDGSLNKLPQMTLYNSRCSNSACARAFFRNSQAQHSQSQIL